MKQKFPPLMLGAVCGDIAGSRYEFDNIKYKLSREALMNDSCRFTDDTVMTCAVAAGLDSGLNRIKESNLTEESSWLDQPEAEALLYGEVQRAMQFFGRRYPYAGYGGRFENWIYSGYPQPYNSWGNGSAMRVSYAGWAAKSLQEAERLAEISALVTHNHPDGISGAKAIAGSIFILRMGGTKEDVRQYVTPYYALDFTLDDIRAAYRFDVSCRGSVPQAVCAFLEGEDYMDVIANAISIGGDSDTIAAMAGSMAEVIYPIPEEMKAWALRHLDPFLIETLTEVGKGLEDAGGSFKRTKE